MPETLVTHSLTPELPNIVALLAQHYKESGLLHRLYLRENVVFAVFTAAVVLGFAYAAVRRPSRVPGRMQAAGEMVAELIDNLVCGIAGHRGRRLVPFIGTLFVYILCMNLAGLVPFLHAATASLSTTLALALTVFGYVQYTAVRELGLRGYLNHLAGNLGKPLAYSVVLPVFMLLLHMVTEIVRPLSLALRLRSIVWGDDVLLAVLSNFGFAWFPLLFVNMLMGIVTAVIQAFVFCILTAIYFALIMPHDSDAVPSEVSHSTT